MQVTDIVKIIEAPSLDWMKEYLDERFEVQDFLTGSLKLKMLDADPEWVWFANADNFELVEIEE